MEGEVVVVVVEEVERATGAKLCSSKNREGLMKILMRFARECRRKMEARCRRGDAEV